MSFMDAFRWVLILALALPFTARPESLANTMVVNTTDDLIDAAATCGTVNYVDLPGPDGFVSLREAICAAENDPGPDQINFAIDASDRSQNCDGDGVCTILLVSTALLMLSNLVADVVLAWVDPRIVYE